MEQRFTFNQVASVYQAVRPDYPDALVDDVVAYAGLKPDDAVLEVGCGTGQSTRSFAARGFRILALEPGSEMVRTAAESLAKFGNVELVESTFEAWPAKPASFRLIVAAQSWHWVAPEVRFVKAAEVLLPQGSLAICGHVSVALPGRLLETFEQIYQRHAGKWRHGSWYLPDGPFKRWFDESGLFGPVEHRRYPWKWQHTASSYTDLLRTRSDHRLLEPAKREQLLGEIGKAINGRGEPFEVDYETHLYIAQRLDLPGTWSGGNDG
jgi:SAM-dependent methyltransferase